MELSQQRQAGATGEVDVTPEMVSAGVAAMLDYYSEDLQEEADRVVRDVFSAMASAMFSASPN